LNLDDLLETSCGTKHPLLVTLQSGAVERYHSVHGVQTQCCAEHVWGVLVILHHIWSDASRELLLAALYHDAAEVITGDIPAPTKRIPQVREGISDLETAFMIRFRFPSETDISQEDHYRLKCADYLELCWTCVQQRGAANTLKNGVVYVKEAASKLSPQERHRVERVLDLILDWGRNAAWS
jgi:5'-deoxynucleotidase YfbR-like HD superfamily hydrolase